MLDYKTIITMHYGLHASGRQIAIQLGVSKSGVNDFLKAFEANGVLSYPLPQEITNIGIYEVIYGHNLSADGRDTSYELPDFQTVAAAMKNRRNMTLLYQWNLYKKACESSGKKAYQYRQFCDLYSRWCDEHDTSAHFTPVIGQTMEVDFAGDTFRMVNRITGEIQTIVVFVAVLPYSQYIYAEGMISTKEPEWIKVNNHALEAFGGVPAIVVCDNCKQAVITNKDWIEPELNQDYAEWAEHNHTVIMPAKVRRPTYKSSVEGSVGILEKGIFHELAERQYFDLDQFNADLWRMIDELNEAPFKKKEHNRYFLWIEEKAELMPLPPVQYQYTERATPRVSSDYHICFDNAYYSVDKAFVHKKVLVKATSMTVRIYSLQGDPLCEWPRARFKGQWQTEPSHLPKAYKDFSEWNGPYFKRKAEVVGQNCSAVIDAVLKSRKIEVQTYRQCMGILGFAKRYSNVVLEEACSRAIQYGKPSYTYIKNTIGAIAEELKISTSKENERNKNGFTMSPKATDVDTLLARSQTLAEKSGKGVHS